MLKMKWILLAEMDKSFLKMLPEPIINVISREYSLALLEEENLLT